MESAAMDVQTDVSQASASTETAWEYEHARGKWVRYSEELSKQLNETNNGFVETEIEEAKLRLDVNTMKQLNTDTGFSRSIRCTIRTTKDEAFACWEGKKGRRYEGLPYYVQVALENGKNGESLEIDIDAVKWKVDFDAMEMSTGENIQKIRRTESTAESSFSNLPTLPATRTRTLTKRNVNVEEMTKEEEIEEKDEEQPKKKSKSTASAKGRSKSAKKEEVEEEEEPKKKSKKGASAKGRSKKEEEEEPKKNGKSGASGKSQKRTLIMKSRAPVDPECSQKLRSAHVLEEGDIVWDAMLNQTNIANNNNKYFILQLLEDDASKKYSVWFRWGRVGYNGQATLHPFGKSIEGAKTCFTKKFYDKTLNEWANKDSFESRGKYTLIHVDFQVPKKNEGEEKEEEEDKAEEAPESKLDDRIQRLLSLICNLQAMEETVMQMEFDSTRSPLGKLTEKQIAEGYRLLGEIEKLIKKRDFNRDFVHLVNEYYTKIPHNFGFQQPPLIKTVEALKKETDLLSVLEDIEIAVRNFGEAKKGKEKIATVDKYYNNMHCDVEPLAVKSDNYKMVEKYLKTTHGDTHMYSMKIKNVYQIERHTETERFRGDISNRMLLWHGSRVTNFYGILSQGLRIAPPEAPSCGYMFGKGIYFADMASKSGNYCYPVRYKPGLLLLCEVALGDQKELNSADYEADKKLGECHSTLGVGKTCPNKEEFFTLDDGVVVPCGKPVKNKAAAASSSALLYNEYIVYSVDQVRIRFCVEVEFDI